MWNNCCNVQSYAQLSSSFFTASVHFQIYCVDFPSNSILMYHLGNKQWKNIFTAATSHLILKDKSLPTIILLFYEHITLGIFHVLCM